MKLSSLYKNLDIPVPIFSTITVLFFDGAVKINRQSAIKRRQFGLFLAIELTRLFGEGRLESVITIARLDCPAQVVALKVISQRMPFFRHPPPSLSLTLSLSLSPQAIQTNEMKTAKRKLPKGKKRLH